MNTLKLLTIYTNNTAVTGLDITFELDNTSNLVLTNFHNFDPEFSKLYAFSGFDNSVDSTFAAVTLNVISILTGAFEDTIKTGKFTETDKNILDALKNTDCSKVTYDHVFRE